jgi:fructokinase
MERYEVSMVALTKGAQGSEIHDAGGSFAVGPVRHLSVADTVGAGDAYASILALGYLAGWHPERILEAASRFSAAACRIKGALPASDTFYDPYRGIIKDGNDEQ